MKRQHLKLVALACSAVFGLAACGSSGGSSDSAPNFSGADAGGAIFGNGFAKNNNGGNGNGNGNNNAGNNANNCGFFGCSPSNPGNNGGGNNGGGNNGGNANNNNGGNNNARPAPNFTVNDGIGYYYGEGSAQFNRRHGFKTEADPLTIKATDDLKTLDIDGFLVNVNGADNTPADKAYNPVLEGSGGLSNGYNPSNRNDLTYGMRTNSSRALQYSRFGAMERTEFFYDSNDRGSFNTSSAFSIGKVTPASSMPTTGTATYSGYAVDDSWRKANFAVDFGAKTVEGRLMSQTDPNMVYYKLSGVINGSSFAGLNTEDNNEIRMRGRFYGPHAEEIGGVYNGIATRAGIMGAFGAAKE